MTTRLSPAQSLKLMVLIGLLLGTLTVAQAQNQTPPTRVPKTQTLKKTSGAAEKVSSLVQSKPASTTATRPGSTTGR